MIKPDSTQTEKHLVRKTMNALGIIILSGLFIMMIISVIYIYWKSCMTMLLSAIGLTVLLLAEIATFILIMKIMHKKRNAPAVHFPRSGHISVFLLSNDEISSFPAGQRDSGNRQLSDRHRGLLGKHGYQRSIPQRRKPAGAANQKMVSC